MREYRKVCSHNVDYKLFCNECAFNLFMYGLFHGLEMQVTPTPITDKLIETLNE